MTEASAQAAWGGTCPAKDGAPQVPPEWEAFQEGLVLSACPAGSRVLAVRSYQPDYRAYPMEVTVGPPDGAPRTLVVKAYEDRDTAKAETDVLSALRALGLPVQETLAGPALLPRSPAAQAVAVRDWLPGRSLPAYDVRPQDIDLTCRLTIEGVQRLHQQTGHVQSHPACAALPRKTLQSELEAVVATGGLWSGVPLVAEVLRRLPPGLAAVEAPLVFSSGDYNPLNFLTDGNDLVGMLDFASACFEDPHIGFCRFMLWSRDRGWAPFSHGGLVERWLYTHNVSRSEFAPRLALEAVRILQQTVPRHGEGSEGYRRHVLELLEQCVEDLPRG